MIRWAHRSGHSAHVWIPGALLLSYGLVALAYLSFISWDRTVLDLFGFRQAQTAISAYWMAKGSPLLAYETPVAGYPWSIPFEFPIYQWLTALISAPGQISVDQAGRLVSVAFFLASAALVYKITQRLWGDRGLALAVVGGFVASPMALFWARALLIESTALFFSLAFLYAMLEFYLTPRKCYAMAATLLATAAAVVKITTFYGFALLLALLLLALLIRSTDRKTFKRNLQTCAVAGGAVAISLATLAFWLWFADGLKAQTPLGEAIASKNIGAFTYGTLQQRMDTEAWRTIIFGRALVDVIGSGWILLAAMIVLAAQSSLRWVALLLFVSYLAPFLTFTNLHFLHDYYQFANFSFLSVIVGLAVGSLARQGRVGILTATIAAMVVIAASVMTLNRKFVPAIKADQSQSRTIEIARFLRAHTKSSEALLIFGVDWSSELPYYATRKSIAVPDWTSTKRMRLLLDSKAAFGGMQVGAIVICPNSLAPPYSSRRSLYQAILSKYSQGLSSRTISGCEILAR